MICAFLQLKLFFFSSCLKISPFYLFFMFGNVKRLSGGGSVKLSLNFNNKNTTHNIKILKFPCVIIKKNFFLLYNSHSDSRMCQIIFPIPNMKVSISLVCVNDLLKAYLLCLSQFSEPNLGDERNKMYKHVVQLGGGLKWWEYTWIEKKKNCLQNFNKAKCVFEKIYLHFLKGLIWEK